MRETQQSIGEWGRATFGQPRTPATMPARFLREFAELLQRIVDDPFDPKIGGELGDCGIMLNQIAYDLGRHLDDEIDRKMVINRARKWTVTEFGHGQHVEEDA